jgi:hypothetical protein
MKPFEKWEYEEVEMTFGLRRTSSLPLLTAWLGAQEPLSAAETDAFNNLKEELASRAEDWNEDELKFFFISPFVRLINFNEPGKFSAFSQRNISTEATAVSNERVVLRGRVEFMVATGKQRPRQPFFCLHEYKPQLRGQSDPLGQLLVAMLAVSKINDDPQQPVLGCYVLGKLWHFVVLEGNEYASSASFDVSQDEILKVAAALKWCKRFIETHL